MPGGKTLKDLQWGRLPVCEVENFQNVPEQHDGTYKTFVPKYTILRWWIGGNMGSMTSVEMELFACQNRRLKLPAWKRPASSNKSLFDSIPLDVQAKMLVDGLPAQMRIQPEERASSTNFGNYTKTRTSMPCKPWWQTKGSGMADYEDVFKRTQSNWIELMSNMMREKPTISPVGAFRRSRRSDRFAWEGFSE